MALDDNPWCFPFEGRLWVSELPREEMYRQITTQRAWDAANARHERWGVAIALGAAIGVVVTLALGSVTNTPPVVNLFILPLGFAIGAVLGAVANKRIRAVALANSPLPDRPVAARMTRVPRSLAAKLPPDATAEEILERISPRRN